MAASSDCKRLISTLLTHLAARCGIIVNTLNPAYKSMELEYALVKSGSKLLFLPGEESAQNSINDFWSVLRSINLEATSLRSVVSLDTKIQKPLRSAGIKLAELNDLLKSNGKQNDFSNVNADDPAIIMFTSGNRFSLLVTMVHTQLFSNDCDHCLARILQKSSCNRTYELIQCKINSRRTNLSH